MDIAKKIQFATENYVNSEKFEKYIINKVEVLANDIVNDSLSSYGDIAKTLKEEVKKKISFNVNDIGLNGIGKMLTDVVEKKIKTTYKELAYEKVSKQLNNIFSPIEKKISINELKKVILEASSYNLDSCGADIDLDDLENLGYDEDDAFTFIIEKSENDEYNWINIYFDEKTNKSKYNCTYNFTVHEDFTSFRINNKEVSGRYAPFATTYGIEDFIYKMYLNDSMIDHTDALQYV